MSVDPATFSIVTSIIVAVAREMSTDLLRTAYSSIIREAADASTGLLDRDGNAIAQAENIPIHLNSMGPALRECLKVYGLSELTPQSVLVSNDPYSGGQHLSDVFFFSPIFSGDEVVAFAGSCGHFQELGGSSGYNLRAQDVFQERLRLIPMKFELGRDWPDGMFARLIRGNVRSPREVIGDMNAMLAANKKGVVRMTSALKRYGKDTLLECMGGYLDYCERMLRDRIAQAPDGVYEGEDWIDDDGLNSGPIRIAVSVEIAGNEVHVDFTGTDDQVTSAMNCPFASTVGSVQTAVKMLLSDPDVPFNEGFNRPVHISAPLGSILNPRPYAPCEARQLPVIRSFQAVVKAFSKVLPEQVAATGYDTRTGIRFWRVLSEGGYEFHSDPLGGGYGANYYHDGESQLDDPLGNCRNTPAEAFELSQDFFRVLCFELIPDSGGPGKYRGGLGARRCYEILEDNIRFSWASDRFQHRPEGLFGGQPGTCASIEIHRNDDTIQLPSKGDTVLMKGDIVEVRIGGGGGYGPVEERLQSLVRSDLLNGRITAESARSVYGIEI